MDTNKTKKTQFPTADFRVISDREFTVGNRWYNQRSESQTLITGDLADFLRDYFKLQGDAVIIEDGVANGYSEYTQQWDYEARLEIGGIVAIGSSRTYSREYTNYGYGEAQRFSTGESENFWGMPQVMAKIANLAKEHYSPE